MPSSAQPINIGPAEETRRRFYLRFSVADEAGVLARICDIFWKHDISIAAVIQKEAFAEDYVPLVMTIHLAREGDLQAAIEKVDRLAVVKAPTRLIRILNAHT